MKKPIRLFFAIVVLALLALYVDLPTTIPLNISIGSFHLQHTFIRPSLRVQVGPVRLFKDLTIHQGLDLKGGTHLVFEADMSGIEEKDREDALRSSEEIISRRVDLYGI